MTMQELVMSQEEIKAACQKIGKALAERLGNEKKLPVFICVMKGALNFMAELLKYTDIPLIEDYVQLKSYSGLQSTGKVSIEKDITTSIDNRVVVIIEDVVDTGYSMTALTKHLQEIGKPKEILIACLCDKTGARKVPVHVDYAGKVFSQDKFLIGFGLDYNGLKRNVPYVYTPTKEEVAEMDEILKDKM
jgi:hypoxanthine phosphoribosyltransferase